MTEYPPVEFLKELTQKPCDNFHEFMAQIKPYWAFSGWGWRQDGDIYYLSTGGWSGNEDIINALETNFMFYLMYWMRSSRGGHYIFAPCTMDVISKLLGEGETVSIDDKSSLAHKALSIIEHIASHEQIDREHTWLIYEAAHVALGECRADHSEWVAKIEGLYNKLKQEKRL
jgi:hypothetical protein